MALNYDEVNSETGETVWEELYTGGYTDKWNRESLFAYRVEALASGNKGIQVSPGSSVLIIGAGFGFLAEYLVDNYQFNVNNLRMIENSTYIHNNLTVYSRVGIRDRIYNIDALSPTVLVDLRAFIGGNGRSNWVITDDIIPGFTDSEVVTFLNNCEALQGGQGGIVHLISTHQDYIQQDNRLNWKTITQWRDFNGASYSSHYWFDTHFPNDLIGGA